MLCEINVSSVYPFPEDALAPLAAETMARLQRQLDSRGAHPPQNHQRSALSAIMRALSHTLLGSHPFLRVTIIRHQILMPRAVINISKNTI